MKSKFLFLLLPVGAIVTVLAQGPLTPTGAPAPVMKTLDQVEPRTPVSGLPFTITQPGSYYFSRDLQFTATDGPAITIASDNVTLDLMGFTLSSKSNVTGNAITLTVGARNVEVRNGNIQGNTAVTIRGATWVAAGGGFSRGISAEFGEALYCHFHHLRITGCRFRGIYNFAMVTIDRVTVAHCGDGGISADSGTITNSIVEMNAGDVTNNGIYIGSGGTVSQCIVNSNGGSGISASYGSVSGCTALRNGWGGITVFEGSVTNSVAYGNGRIGIQANNGSITNCSATTNGSHGIFSPDGVITSCSAKGNDADGIAGNNGVVAFCRATGNNTGGGALDIDGGGATRTGNNPAP